MAQTVAVHAASPVLEIGQDIRRPLSLKETLANLELAIRRDYLVRDTFYSDQNLMHVLGGSRIGGSRIGGRGTGASTGAAVDGGGSRRWVVPPVVTSPPIEGIVFDLGWQATAGSSLQAKLSIEVIGETDLCLDDVEAIFGRTWKRPDPDPAAPQEGRPAATTAQGYETVEYIYRAPTALHTLAITFRPDGSFDHALIVSNGSR
jgi:hypothetical protein